MASVNGTIPTEGLPGAPILTVLRVTTDGPGAATDIPGAASTDAATMVSARGKRFRAAPSTFERVSICSHRLAPEFLEHGGRARCGGSLYRGSGALPRWGPARSGARSLLSWRRWRSRSCRPPTYAGGSAFEEPLQLKKLSADVAADPAGECRMQRAGQLLPVELADLSKPRASLAGLEPMLHMKDRCFIFLAKGQPVRG